jgi:hypothetical protein
MTQRVFGTEVLDFWLQNRMADVHTALPAKVLAYDAAAQTVDVRPEIKRYIFDDEGTRTAEALPDLYGIPVAFPRGGGFHVSFPLAVDDYVLVICSEEPTISWRDKARAVEPGIFDRHGLNGTFALPCGYPDKEKLPSAPSGTELELASDNGSSILRMDSSGTITVTGDLVVSGEVTAGNAVPATSVSLTTHTHPSGTGPTGAPTPGS